jgi:mono/diheme cytochrome c family protein
LETLRNELAELQGWYATEAQKPVKTRFRYFCAFAVLALAFGIVLPTSGRAISEAKASPQSDPQFQQLIRSVAGPDLFRAYCASCHGSDAKGHGPAAEAMKTRVPDLTRLASDNGGKFPDVLVRKTIMGDDVIAAHGSRKMPIWGPIFHQIEDDVDRGNVRLDNLIQYLESIQSLRGNSTPEKRSGSAQATVEASASGAQIFRRNCAACHGNDLKGNGPAPPPFKDRTPDLTTLAQRHDGKFPDTYVTSVLRNGVAISGHGPAEMPIWGATFKESEKLSAAQIDERITKLISYLKSMQSK